MTDGPVGISMDGRTIGALMVSSADETVFARMERTALATIMAHGMRSWMFLNATKTNSSGVPVIDA